MILAAGAVAAIIFLPDPWRWVVVGAAIIVEIAETAFWIWLSKRGRPRVGTETLVGRTATVVVACEPEGHVRVAGELWRARCLPGALPGELVTVGEVQQGLLLIVERRTDSVQPKHRDLTAKRNP